MLCKCCKLFCAVLLLLCTRPLAAQPVLFSQPLSPRIANYNIDVKLEPATRKLYGKEQLLWHNKSSDTITELQFHLYLNAFRNSRSTFMKESGGTSRGNQIDKDGWGYIDVNRFALASGEDLTHAMRFIQPDDDNSEDKTVFSVPLSSPLAPNDSIVVEIDFTAQLPQPPFARTGAKDEYFFVAQWFPKIGVYIDGKWNCHQFHATSEFFADYGVYNVRMTVPKENVLGATGVEVEVKDNGDGTATHFYHAEDVHDFAWTTSPEFRVHTDFNKTKDIAIRVLMQPDHDYQAARHMEAAKTAVDYFQDWYGDYPFPNLTVVDPRRGASGSGGMEYPTLITAGTNYGLPEGVRAVEMVIIHEFGHNFWYHLLASNEFEESWMDEGINSYTETDIVENKYGPHGDMINLFGIKINNVQTHRMRYLTSKDYDPIMRYVWKYYNGSSFGTNSYSKPAVLLMTLHNYLGEETMRKVMRTYVERWRFKHPKTRDFINVVNDVTGQDFNWYFEQALFTNLTLDYSVDRVRTTEVKEGKGYDFEMATTAKDTSLTNGHVRNDRAEDSVAAKGKTKFYTSEVFVRRLGQFKFPVEMVATFENGEKVRETWDGQDTWHKFSFVKPTKLASATIDPENKIVLDLNYTNNSKMVEPSSLGVNKLSARYLFWMQFLLEQPEWIALPSFEMAF